MADSQFEVTIVQLSGHSVVLGGNRPSDDLQALHSKVAKMFHIPRGAVKLVLGAASFSPQDHLKSLSSLGVESGTVLTFVNLAGVEVKLDKRVVSRGAGADAFNGTYIGRSSGSGELFLQKVGGSGSFFSSQHVRWHEEVGGLGGWPAGWYMKELTRGSSRYFSPSDDRSWISCSNWVDYQASTFSKPGVEPVPIMMEASQL